MVSVAERKTSSKLMSSKCRLQGTLFATAAAQVSQLEADRVPISALLLWVPFRASQPVLCHQCSAIHVRFMKMSYCVIFASGLEFDGQPAERVC